ncbi:hypothetical protein LCGC14_2994120, partial [marine sediment metagenome]
MKSAPIRTNPEEKFIGCRCTSMEHVVRFTYWPEDTTKHYPAEVFVSIHLSHYGFFRRLWTGLKYAFGYRCRYGDWDEVILDTEEMVELRDFLNDCLKD